MIANGNHCLNSLSTVRHKEGLLPIKLLKTRAQHRQTEPHTLFQATLSVLQNHRSENAITCAAATRAPSWINPSGRPLPPHISSAPHGELWNVEVPRKLVHALMLAPLTPSGKSGIQASPADYRPAQGEQGSLF